MMIEERVKDWRWRITRAGYSLAKFGEGLNISPTMMSRYASGKSIPNVRIFDKIESKLKKLGV